MDKLNELDKYLSDDSKMSLKGMATTLGINFGIAFGIFMIFSILRPKHNRKVSSFFLYLFLLLCITDKRATIINRPFFLHE